MNPNLGGIKIQFVVVQFLILALALAAGGIILGINSVQQADKVWMDELDRITRFVASQVDAGNISLLNQDKDIKAALDSIEGDISQEEYLAITHQNMMDPISTAYHYRYFVIDKDGRFVVPRSDQDVVASQDWARYQEKLVYEMMKKGQGWIFYPDGDHQQKKVIRYVQGKNGSLIIALEGEPESEWVIFRRIVNNNVLMRFVEILCFGFLAIQLSVHLIFLKVQVQAQSMIEKQYGVTPNQSMRVDFSREPTITRRQGQDQLEKLVHVEMRKLEEFKKNMMREVSALKNQGNEANKVQPPIEVQLPVVENVKKKELVDQAKHEHTRMEFYFNQVLGK